jgi:hypothetical protein
MLFIVEMKFDEHHSFSSSKELSRIYSALKSKNENYGNNQGLDNLAKPIIALENPIEVLLKNGNLPIENPPQRSRYAYVTLISGINRKYTYRGFLYNALIMHKSLQTQGSTADFIALIGYSENDTSPFVEDLNLLKSHGIIIYELPRLVNPKYPLRFAEMALLKITPYSFDQYEKIQFFDGDVMPTMNMDCFFHLPYNTFTIGAVSPLNSGWYLALPKKQIYEILREKAIWRLFLEWDEIKGWGEELPQSLTVRGGRPVGKPLGKWNFNGADMDQGLFTHYFVINHGNVVLMDTDLNVIRYYQEGIVHNPTPQLLEAKVFLSGCKNMMPTRYFAHFTGRNKPWMLDLKNLTPTKKNADLITWTKLLDSLQLPVNSTNINDLKLGSPLGFFNVNFPKGGYKKEE